MRYEALHLKVKADVISYLLIKYEQKNFAVLTSLDMDPAILVISLFCSHMDNVS